MGIYAFAGSLFLAWSVFLGLGAYYKGRDSRADEVASLMAGIKESQRLTKEAELRAANAEKEVVTVYKDRVRTIVERQPGEVQIVEKIVREIDPNCSMPPDYRVLWNGGDNPNGAAGQDTQGTDAGAVPLAEVVESTRLARKAFDENLAQLEGWRELARKNGWEIK